MNPQSTRQGSVSQMAFNAQIETRLIQLEENYEKILLVLRGHASEANGKDSVIGRLHTMEVEQRLMADELSKHLDFHRQMQAKMDEEQKERREFQQKIILTMIAFVLSNVGVILLSLRYMTGLLIE